MARLGYARVSTRGQDPAPQVAALTAAGCDQVWVEKASGYRDDRPELAALLAYAREGDAVVVVQLARLGRSVPHVLTLARDFEQRGLHLVSLSDAIDTTTATGRFTFTILAAVAALEGELRRERQELAWSEGKQKGRPTVLTPEQLSLARQMRDGGKSFAQIGAAIRVSKSTAYRALSPITEETPCPSPAA